MLTFGSFCDGFIVVIDNELFFKEICAYKSGRWYFLLKAFCHFHIVRPLACRVFSWELTFFCCFLKMACQWSAWVHTMKNVSGRIWLDILQGSSLCEKLMLWSICYQNLLSLCYPSFPSLGPLNGSVFFLKSQPWLEEDSGEEEG